MKIAVASTDGVTVAHSLAEARGFLVFEVAGDEVGSPVRRKRGRSGWQRPSVPLVRIREGGGTRVPAQGAACVAEEGVAEDLLREMLDCEAVVAGTFEAAERAELQRLSILTLPTLPGEKVEAAVRFVVSGAPPKEGEVCGHCPKRQDDA